MAWVAVDKNGSEYVYQFKPFRGNSEIWVASEDDQYVSLPEGSIKKLIGFKITWESEPVELK